MTPEEQINLLEKKVVEEAIYFCSWNGYENAYTGDLEKAVERLLDFKAHGSFKEDRERIQKEKEEAERRSRIELEVNALICHPEFQDLTPKVITNYVSALKYYQECNDSVMAESIKEALKRRGVEVFENTVTAIGWRRTEEGDRV